MREEHLKRLLVIARKEENAGTEATTTVRAGIKENSGTKAVQSETETTEADNWTMVVDLTHLAFREGKLAEEATWQAVVLIPKGKTDYRGIGLVEVMWKVAVKI